MNESSTVLKQDFLGLRLPLKKLLTVLAVASLAVVFAGAGKLSNLTKTSDGILHPRNAILKGRFDYDWGISYYQELAKAFLHGQASLLIEPPKELKALRDPYDPVQNVNYRLHDASYFGGKYYLYWGPAPVIVFFIPLKILTGYFPSDNFANLFFYILICAFSALVFADLMAFRANGRPSFDPWVFALISLNGALTFSLASPSIYLISILAGQAFFMMGLWFGLRSIESRSFRWLILEGACFGLAIGSRVSLVPACFWMALGFAWISYRRKIGLDWVRRLVCVFLPISLSGVALGIYNFVRFGSVLDSGIKYQLIHKWSYLVHPIVEWSWTALRERVPSNFRYYLIRRPVFLHSFPFVFPRAGGPNTVLPFEAEYMVGFIWQYLPMLVLLGVAFSRFRRDPKFIKFGLLDSPFFWLIFAVIGTFLILLPNSFNTMRYLVDFAPLTIVLSETYLASYLPENWSWLRRLTAAVSILLGVGLGFSGYWGWCVK